MRPALTSAVLALVPTLGVLGVVSLGAQATTLGQGTIDLPAATAGNDVGFTEEKEAVGRIPNAIGSTAGSTIQVVLRDASRPAVTCDRDHPLSGCATVDWDFGPIFDNFLSVELDSGPTRLYLNRFLDLELEKDLTPEG